jgi:hypothetical protein
VYAFTVPEAFLDGFEVSMIPIVYADVDILLFKTRPDANSCGAATSCTATAYICPDVLTYADIPWSAVASFKVSPDMIDSVNQVRALLLWWGATTSWKLSCVCS